MAIKIFGKEFFKTADRSAETETITGESFDLTRRKPGANVFTPNSGSTPAQGYVYGYYDGEKSLGEMGPIKIYQKDFYALRARSKQLYIEAPVCYIGINTFIEWVIGPGLRLKAEPVIDVLKKNKITLDTKVFNRDVESLWKVYAASKAADYSGQQNLHSLSEEALREAKLGGDMLVLLRLGSDNLVKVQHIDGGHVGNPPNCAPLFGEDELVGSQSTTGFDYKYETTGNRIRQGVEIDSRGQHVAYHVRVGTALQYIRVPARDSNGFLRAFMVYGSKPEIDATRGTPLLQIIMEEAKKFERYLSASLAGAEERAKFAIFIEHLLNGDGEDPFAGIRARASVGRSAPGGGAAATDIAVDVVGNKIAADVAVSQNKTAVNLPPGAKASTLESRQELHVGEFSSIICDIIFAAIRVPPNVAMQKYDTSFSSGRLAGKSWERTFMTEREDFSDQYLDPIEALQIWVWVNEGKIDAPGYLEAMARKDILTVEAYKGNRWVGDMFPDIDPLKTIKYVREALGTASEHAPLMTLEDGAETIGKGDYEAIAKQYGEELEIVDKNNIKSPDESIVPPDTGAGEKEGEVKKKDNGSGNG